MRDIKKIIEERHSVRAYTKAKIESTKKEIILNLMKELKTQDFRFDLIDYTFDENVKIGTYGMISGAHSFIVGMLNREKKTNHNLAMDFGESFEKLILKATELGLGTCWMVSTFNSDTIESLINLNPSEDVVMVSPIGYGNEKSLKHRFTRFMIKADKRKPWDELFYDSDFQRPLNQSNNDKINEILEAIRLAPSAANKQPWRIVKTDMTFDFYIDPKAYMSDKNQKINVTYNDMGIARCHFKLMAKHYDYKTTWFVKEYPLDSKTYVGSMKVEAVD
jgi:nitroreductase